MVNLIERAYANPSEIVAATAFVGIGLYILYLIAMNEESKEVADAALFFMIPALLGFIVIASVCTVTVGSKAIDWFRAGMQEYHEEMQADIQKEYGDEINALVDLNTMMKDLESGDLFEIE